MPARRSAFSMVEMVVVVVILGVLAMAVVPRMISTRGREVQASALRLADLLTIAARRDSLLSQRIAVEFDARDGRLRLVTLVVPEPESGAAAVWKPDALAPAADIGNARVLEAWADGSSLDPRQWRVELPQNQMRPAIAMVLADAGGQNLWRVDLAPRATRAVVTAGQTPAREGVEGSEFIDLDANGQGVTPW
ncbi:MAG: prepilin-type N-terminal cleavage/methylation domain-containing protein [Phycisphaerales bacterium]|nr:prepilin-type N-terminal cleavage/methylation domain-containing protein [Phycisphaerales bacterium]